MQDFSAPTLFALPPTNAADGMGGMEGITVPVRLQTEKSLPATSDPLAASGGGNGGGRGGTHDWSHNTGTAGPRRASRPSGRIGGNDS